MAIRTQQSISGFIASDPQLNYTSKPRSTDGTSSGGVISILG